MTIDESNRQTAAGVNATFTFTPQARRRRRTKSWRPPQEQIELGATAPVAVTDGNDVRCKVTKARSVA
jgi:hypothetical protein